MQTGSEVAAFKSGDRIGVGCMVDARGIHSDCHDHQEQFCNQTVFTYNSPDKYNGKYTHGGYSNLIVVDMHP